MSLFTEFPTPNNDENTPSGEIQYIGNFHKTLPHNDFGEVEVPAYRKFKEICLQIEARLPLSYNDVAQGSLATSTFVGPRPSDVARFTNPLAAAATETSGPDPKAINIIPAPGVRSASTAAEFTELYWMALLRDVPLVELTTDSRVSDAVTELSKVFADALANDKSEGGLRLGLDLPVADGALDISVQTLFRSGLRDEQYGPLVSQFFLRDIQYGAQSIRQRLRPYAAKRDFLTSYEDWIRAQNTGYDRHARGYSTCNFFADDAAYYAAADRHISTMRDLARFVNRDALHQAYFNAALFLDAARADVDEGNPYRGARYGREGDFGTLGGPDLLTLVSEVASRALKVIWRQKWFVHRRARPEAYGGLVQMQFKGRQSDKRAYGLPNWVAETKAAQAIELQNGAVNPDRAKTLFLPMAFSAGSPTHPAYGAGHATVAGACVTVLKAWFREDQSFVELLDRARQPLRQRDPFTVLPLLQPGSKLATPDSYGEPTPYTGPDASRMTVGGELNKIASNVAMGRSMGGVHWRSDNTRSLRVGERIAIEILRKRTVEYAERPVSFTFRSFDGQMVQVSSGQVRMF
ncbi:MAG: hypothetical protein RL701_1113 [Pseudomonadota bacterium]|jgi:hypothetical protein